MAKLRRPHVVPAGYQRNFAAGQHILVITKASMSAHPIGVRDNFVASHFLRVIIAGVSSDDAEDQFARIENAALPLIKQLAAFGARTEEQLYALKATMAMLWSRSFAREVVAQRIFKEVVATFRDDPSEAERVRVVFRHHHGREPLPGEFEGSLEEASVEFTRQRLHDVNSTLEYHNKALAKFDPLHVSLYRPIRGCEFVTSDNPVLLARTPELIHVGMHNGLALGDASFIFLPITRFVGACLTKEPEGDFELDRLMVLRLNQAMWRNAVQRVACHPALVDDWPKVCNVSIRP